LDEDGPSSGQGSSLAAVQTGWPLQGQSASRFRHYFSLRQRALGAISDRVASFLEMVDASTECAAVVDAAPDGLSNERSRTVAGDGGLSVDSERVHRARGNPVHPIPEETVEGAGRKTMSAEDLQRDVLGFQQSLEALGQTEERWRLALQGANDGVWDWDVQKNEVYYSPAWKSMLGYEDHEVSCGFDEWRSRVHPDDLAQALVYVDETIKGLRVEYKNIHRMRHRNGSFRWILARGQLIRDEMGRPCRMIGTHVDVTECKEREAQLHVMPAQLMAAQDEERRRIANELHDGVGQSLNAARFSVEQFMNVVDEGASDDGLGHLKNALEQIQTAMNEVRGISMDLMPPMLEDLGLLATVKWFCRAYRDTYPDIRITSKVSVEEEQIAPKLKLALYRILQEGMNNVAKHARATKVRFQLSRTGTGLILQISDNGQGFRPDCGSQHGASGTGIGLRSMRERAESNGGRFRIETSLGKGCTIYVTWPDAELQF
jgi:two-component system sensor histidine kinase UhpB